MFVGQGFRFLRRVLGISEDISYADFSYRVADFLEAREWTHHQYARNKDGYSVNVSSRRAVQFCSMGAIYRNYFDLKPYILSDSLDIWLREFSKYLMTTEYRFRLAKSGLEGAPAIVHWNDSVGFLDKEAVVRVFRGFAEVQRCLEEPNYLYRRVK